MEVLGMPVGEFARQLSEKMLQVMTQGHCKTAWLPVEVVIREPSKVPWDSMIQARAWPLRYWKTVNGIADYDQLRRLEGFSGTAAYDNFKLYLMEQWEDVGSDGHVQFRLSGWKVSCFEDVDPRCSWWDLG